MKNHILGDVNLLNESFPEFTQKKKNICDALGCVPTANPNIGL